MLALSRTPGEKIILTFGKIRIEVMVVSVRGNLVRLGIEAPREVNIMRAELEKGSDENA